MTLSLGGPAESRAEPIYRICFVDRTPCIPDNFEHTFCWGNGFDRVNYRDAARYAMTNLDEQTRYDRNYASDCTRITDVVWREFNLDGFLGGYQCKDTNSAGECEKAWVLINPSEINSGHHAELNRDVTSCHELGHSGALDHEDQASDCMKSGRVSSGHRRYSDPHNVNHLNRRN